MNKNNFLITYHLRVKNSIKTFQILIFIFIIGASTLSYIEGLSKIVILYGLTFTFLYFIYTLYTKKISIQPETIIYFAWVLWSLGGLTNAANKAAYFQGLRTVIQIAFMFIIIAGLISTKPYILSAAMSGLLVGGLIQGISTFLTGELPAAIESDTRTRLAGLSKNANTFAFQMLTIVFSIFYFWKLKRNRIIRFFLSCSLIIALVGIIYSGSRNGFLSILVFIFLWYFSQQKKLPKQPILAYTISLIIIIIGYLSIVTLLEKTLIWQRLYQFEDNSSQTRIYLYKEGLEMVMKKPFWGIGLNNFSELSTTGLYSHSDYVEVAATTGIIGFFLYFSIYIVLWRRITRIKKLTSNSDLLHITGIFKASILATLFFGFGKPHITSKVTWIFISTLVGYTWYIEHYLKNLKPDNHIKIFQ